MKRHEKTQSSDRPEHDNDIDSDMSGHVNGSSGHMPPPVRATIEEAARLLGVSENAVRKRIERGTLCSKKVKGTRYVFLDGDIPQHATDGLASMYTGMLPSMSALVDSLEEQIEYMRAHLAEEREAQRRADSIIAQLTQANAALAQRVPEIESSYKRGSAVSSAEKQGNPSPTQGQQEGIPHEERRWWVYRFFGQG